MRPAAAAAKTAAARRGGDAAVRKRPAAAAAAAAGGGSQKLRRPAAAASAAVLAEVALAPTYSGPRDAAGLPHGRGDWADPDGSRYEGEFVHGVREGQGVLRFADGTVLTGSFRAGMPDGRCKFYDPDDQTTMLGSYAAGELHGQAEQRDENGSLVFRGRFDRDTRQGAAEVFDEYGGRVVGVVNEEGDMTGDSIVYVFPDGRTALVGAFSDGEFLSGRYARLPTPLPAPAPLVLPGAGDGVEEGWVLQGEATMPAFELSSEVADVVLRDVSSRETLCSQPLVPDLYELDRVEVRRSAIDPSMDGLFAKTPLSAGEYCSWYNGLRCTHEEVNGRDWSLNQATITLDADTVLDVPAASVPVTQFCACLGHKANHSAPNNAKYDVFDHPRFGLIKAVRAVRDIEAGEEVCCDYGYEGDASDLPAWYTAAAAAAAEEAPA